MCEAVVRIPDHRLDTPVAGEADPRVSGPGGSFVDWRQRTHAPEAFATDPSPTYDAMRRTHPAPLPLVTALLLSAAVAACDDEPTSPGNPQDISITVSPGSVTMLQGEMATLSATLASTGGYTETITVFAEDAPGGVSVSQETVDGGAGTATLEIDASVIANVGTSTVTVTATGPGVSSTSTTFDLTVESAGGFALAVDPAVVGMTLGDTARATIGIARIAPFAGPVELAIAGGPSGLTTTLDSTTVAGDSTFVTLVADTAVANEGRYTLIVRGLGEGVSGDLVGFLVTLVR